MSSYLFLISHLWFRKAACADYSYMNEEFTKVQTVGMHEAISQRNMRITTFVFIPSTGATAHSS